MLITRVSSVNQIKNSKKKEKSVQSTDFSSILYESLIRHGVNVKELKNETYNRR